MSVASLTSMWQPLVAATSNNHYYFDKTAHTFFANWLNHKEDPYDYASGLLLATRETFVILENALQKGLDTGVPEFSALWGRVKNILPNLNKSYAKEKTDVKEMVEAATQLTIQNIDAQLLRFNPKPVPAPVATLSFSLLDVAVPAQPDVAPAEAVASSSSSLDDKVQVPAPIASQPQPDVMKAKKKIDAQISRVWKHQIPLTDFAAKTLERQRLAKRNLIEPARQVTSKNTPLTGWAAQQLNKQRKK